MINLILTFLLGLLVGQLLTLLIIWKAITDEQRAREAG